MPERWGGGRPDGAESHVRHLDLWIGVVFLSLGLGALAFGLFFGVPELRLARDGLEARGTVLEKTPAFGWRPIEHYLAYRFRAEDGRDVDGRQQIHQDVWNRLAVGGPVAVVYVRSDPSVNRVVGTAEWVLIGLPLGVGSLFTTIGATLSPIGGRQALLERRLRREGSVAEARVTGIRITGDSTDGEQLWVVEYDYRDDLGVTHAGRSGRMRSSEAAGWRAGDAARIAFDRERPSASIWLGPPDEPG